MSWSWQNYLWYLDKTFLYFLPLLYLFLFSLFFFKLPIYLLAHFYYIIKRVSIKISANQFRGFFFIKLRAVSSEESFQWKSKIHAACALLSEKISVVRKDRDLFHSRETVYELVKKMTQINGKVCSGFFPEELRQTWVNPSGFHWCICYRGKNIKQY